MINILKQSMIILNFRQCHNLQYFVKSFPQTTLLHVLYMYVVKKSFFWFHNIVLTFALFYSLCVPEHWVTVFNKKFSMRWSFLWLGHWRQMMIKWAIFSEMYDVCFWGWFIILIFFYPYHLSLVISVPASQWSLIVFEFFLHSGIKLCQFREVKSKLHYSLLFKGILG